tara:strand:- start:1520 stop:2653 length:1134 start_codon:yes stop_codon:yes gene_type:complete
MQIGFDAKRAFFNNTGLGNYSRDTIRILAIFFKKNKYFLYTPKNTKNSRLQFIYEINNILIKTPKKNFKNFFKKYWRNKRIINDLQKDNLNIYHGLTNELPIGIEKTNIKTVVTIHDLIFIRFPKLYNWVDRKIYYFKFLSACKRADIIIAISKQTKKDIVKYLSIDEKKIKVVYQGCNDVFKKTISQKTQKETLKKYNLPNNFLLYVGKIEERKNLLTILKVLKKLKTQKLVVIGDGNKYKKMCLKYINNNNLHNNVIILSNIPSNEIASIYKNAEILIYPSIFEGFGIPIIEALYSKVPVITTKKGCFKEAGGPKTKYINPNSINELENAILEIQQSSKIKEEMKNIGFKYVQKFNDEKIAKNLIKIYSELYEKN